MEVGEADAQAQLKGKPPHERPRPRSWAVEVGEAEAQAQLMGKQLLSRERVLLEGKEAGLGGCHTAGGIRVDTCAWCLSWMFAG